MKMSRLSGLVTLASLLGSLFAGSAALAQKKLVWSTPPTKAR